MQRICAILPPHCLRDGGSDVAFPHAAEPRGAVVRVARVVRDCACPVGVSGRGVVWLQRGGKRWFGDVDSMKCGRSV